MFQRRIDMPPSIRRVLARMSMRSGSSVVPEEKESVFLADRKSGAGARASSQHKPRRKATRWPEADPLSRLLSIMFPEASRRGREGSTTTIWSAAR